MTRRSKCDEAVGRKEPDSAIRSICWPCDGFVKDAVRDPRDDANHHHPCFCGALHAEGAQRVWTPPFSGAKQHVGQHFASCARLGR
jgi:hypothetical protein